MPKLDEYQGKRLLKGQSIPVPEGDIAITPEKAHAIAQRLSKPVVSKSQIGVTGRFKADGIKFADSPDEAEYARKVVTAFEEAANSCRELIPSLHIYSH